jgi:hypothetical protein
MATIHKFPGSPFQRALAAGVQVNVPRRCYRRTRPGQDGHHGIRDLRLGPTR